MYTQNANEALNSAFKKGYDKKLTLAECVERLQDFITRQQEQVKLSVISCGEYTVLQEYEHLKISDEMYFRMQNKSKEVYLQRVFKAEVKPKNAATNVNSNATITSSFKCLSVPISQCGVTKIPFEIVQVIYSNAEKVLVKQNCIVKPPGDMEDVFFVASLSKVSNGAKVRNQYNQVPHLTQDTNGKVTNSQKTPQTRAKRSALSQQVTTKHI